MSDLEDALASLDVRPSDTALGAAFVGFGGEGEGVSSRTRQLEATLVVHVAVYPSFDDYVGYDLLRGDDDERWFLVRRTWRRTTEPERPRAEAFGCDVDAARAVAWQASFEPLRLPFLAPSPMGLDGTSYEVAAGSWGASMRLRWWQDGPPAWAELTQWVRAFLDDMRALGDWKPLPAAPTDAHVGVWVSWSGAAGVRELKALRSLDAALGEVSLAELRARVRDVAEVSLGPMRWRKAREVQREAEHVGLRVELRGLR